MTMGQSSFEFGLGITTTLGNFGTGQYNAQTRATNIALFDDGGKGVPTDGGANFFGFGAGAGMYVPIGKKKVSICVRADLFYNFLGEEANNCIDDICKYLDQTVGGTFTTKRKPSYVNIPLTVGLRCSFPIAENTKLFVEGGTGINISIISPLKIESTDLVLTREYGTQYTMALIFGGGIQITKHIVISTCIYSLGKRDVDGITKTSVYAGTAPTAPVYQFKNGKDLPIELIAFKFNYTL